MRIDIKPVLSAAGMLLSAFLAQQAIAQDTHPYIGGQLIYINADEDRPGNPDGDRNAGVSGYLGLPVNPNVNVELQLFVNDINTNNGFRDDIFEIGSNVDLVYQWGNRDFFTPFVLGGLGIIRNEMGNNTRSNHTTGYGNLGLGFVFKPMQNTNRYGIRVRGEARYAHNMISGGQDDFQVRVGLELPLGRTETRTVEVEKIVYKEVPATVPPPVDSDGDGVTDDLDQCPRTPKGALVDARGCEQYLKQDIKRTLYVEFDFDKSNVRRESYPKLQELVADLRKYPSARLELEGHTDSTGSTAYNQALSARRAEAVKQVLINHFGISAARISTAAYGESRPIASNDTREGRAKNRRVDTTMKATIKRLQMQ